VSEPRDRPAPMPAPKPTGKPSEVPATPPRATGEAGGASWRLTFRPIGVGHGQALQRVRRLLKAALRAYGLKCTRVEEVGDGDRGGFAR